MSSDNFNKYCEVLLVRYNRRNTQAVARRLDSLCGLLRKNGNHVVQTMLGGSIWKSTYVTGLSDVDVLLIVNQSSLTNQSPAKVIEFVRDEIQRQLPNNSVKAGKLAVTVGYSDGTELQILPAIRKKSGVRIADPGSTKWSRVVHPQRFAEKLSDVNQANSGRVTLVIKLAKAVLDCFITRPSRKISGYHMEALAIDAFEEYGGSLDPKTMLIHLFGYSIKAVMSPIVDSTGQSRFVDDYLGEAESNPRRRASTYFGQMRARVKCCRTRAEFGNLFCEGK